MRLLRHKRGNPETDYVEAYPTAPPLDSTLFRPLFRSMNRDGYPRLKDSLSKLNDFDANMLVARLEKERVWAQNQSTEELPNTVNQAERTSNSDEAAIKPVAKGTTTDYNEIIKKWAFSKIWIVIILVAFSVLSACVVIINNLKTILDWFGILIK